MMIELLIRKDESRQAGAIRGCAAGFVAVVMSILLMFFAFTGDVMACGGDPPGPDCPPCATPDGQGGCILGCQCPCAECDVETGKCYEDCDVEHGFYCCCSSDNSKGECCQQGASCCNGRCCPDRCCEGETTEILCNKSNGCGCDPAVGGSCSDKKERQPAGGVAYYTYGAGTGSGCRVYEGDVPCYKWRTCTEAGSHYMEMCWCGDPDVPECYCTAGLWPYCQDCIGDGEWETEPAPSYRCVMP